MPSHHIYIMKYKKKTKVAASRTSASSATNRNKKTPHTFSSWTEPRTHGRDAYTGESIYQHAHIYQRGFTSVRAPGIRLAVDGKASGRLVSAQLWRHPSHAHILQGSRDQHWPAFTPARQPRPHPAAAHAQPPVLLGGSIIRSHLHLHASIRSRAHMHA